MALCPERIIFEPSFYYKNVSKSRENISERESLSYFSFIAYILFFFNSIS